MDNSSCEEVDFSTIDLRVLARRTIDPGTPGCGDGIVQFALGEECDSATASTACASLGGFTLAGASTTCNPATCTWNRTGCHAAGGALCNGFTAQCFPPDFFGQTGIDLCSDGITSQACTECLDDPAPCPRPMGTSAVVVDNNTTFNMPNTAYTLGKFAGEPATFPVTLSVTNLNTSGFSMSAPTADGTGDCERELQTFQPGLCGNATCAHVCGEVWSDAGNSWHMTGPQARTRFANWGFAQDLRCQNDDGGASGTIPSCATNGTYTQNVSEWDELQYILRTRGVDPTLMRGGVPLGSVGDPLTWGQMEPLVEADPGQNCTFDVDVDVIDPFDPSDPGDYDTVITVDRSGSMGTPSANDPAVIRADLAENAAVAVLQALSTEHVASPAVNYNMALTSFSTDISVESNAMALDATGVTNLTASLGGRPVPAGRTAIGDAIRTSYAELPASARDRFVVLVSDGYHNEGENPVDATRALMSADPQLHICPVYFGENADQADELLQVATAGKCSLRINDPNNNDIVTSMFEMAGERYGGTVIFSDQATVAGDEVIFSGFLSLLTGNNETVSSEVVVGPEMSNLKLLLANSGRESVGWMPPQVRLISPDGSTTHTLSAGTATYNEVARGYRMFELPVSGVGDAGTWTLEVEAAYGASASAITSSISIVADRSNAHCGLSVTPRVMRAGGSVDISVVPTYVHPLDPERVSVKAAVVGPSHDGTLREFPVSLEPAERGQFVGRFTPPSDNGVYSVSALCEASEALTTNIELGASTQPSELQQVPAFRVQTSSAFLVYGGNYVCIEPDDCDGDGVVDADEIPGDADGDGDPNQNDVDSDDDGFLDVDEIGNDVDGDGEDDSVDNDMNNDGVPDFGSFGECTWRTTGGGQTRAGTSSCVAAPGVFPAWTHDEWSTARGVALAGC